MHNSRKSNFALKLSNNNISKWVLRHFYVLLLIPLFFYSYPILSSGISITGDFPYVDTSHYSADKLWMWVDKGSRDGFEFLARYPIMSIWYGLSLLNIGSDVATKIMIVSGFFLSSFCFYFSFSRLFRIGRVDSTFVIKLSALIGSLFYAYNVWSFNRIHHWYLWIGYSILPLFAVSIYYSFRNPKSWKCIFMSTLLWSFASITVHMVIFYGIILVLAFVGFVANDLYAGKKGIKKLAIPLILTISFYILVNMYWIYPYAVSSQIRVPNPPYELTTESLELLSRESNFLNSFRIMAYWLNSGVELPNNLLSHPLWVITTFTVPIIAFSALARKSTKFSIIFAGIALVSIFLTMGTKSPINYFNIALLIPVVSNFVWVFRDPEKWAFFTTFAYSFLIGMVCYKLLGYTRSEKYEHKKRIIVGTIIIFLISSIFISSYPYYQARIEPLIPVQFPAEFDKLNNYLNTINTERVYFIPYPIKETDWDKNGVVQNIYNTHSVKPSIDSSEYYPLASTYYNYFVNSVMENRSNGVRNLINPLATSYVIFHNDSWDKLRDRYDPDSIQLLDKLYQVEGLDNTTNIGFYNIFNTSNNVNSELPRQVNIPYQSIGVIGGLDIFNSLESVPTFSSMRSSLLFLDDIKTANTSSFANGFDDLLIDRSPQDDELALSFLDKRYILTPFDYTTSNDPAKVWSKAGARDPIHGAFHPDLKALGINNWDFDYGHGLVKTKAIANMSIPIDPQNSGQNSEGEDVYLFMRYFKNQKGGPMNIYLDNNFVNQVDAFDKLSNYFVWQNIGTVKLQNEKHTLKLENVGGFNAVNIFALIPETVMNNLRLEYEKMLADKSQVIYLLEAESNFNNIRGKDVSSPAYLVYQNETTDSGNFDRNITGQFKVPKGSDLVSLQFQANKSQTNSHFSIKNMQIIPAQEKYTTFISDFEWAEHSIPLASLRYSDWLNLDKNLSSAAIIPSSSDNGGKSLKVDTKPSDQVGWDIITTNFIPVSDEAYYNASLHLSAKDVLQLHSKIFFFDSQEKEFLGSPHYVLDGKDGTFDETFSSIVVPPEGTKYIKIQVLAKSANPIQSSYTLDNVRFEEIVFPKILKNSMGGTFDTSPNQDISALRKGSIMEHDTLRNGTNYMANTIPFMVKQDHIYDYKLNVAGNDLSSYSVIALFRSSNDVSENVTKYGTNASNGRVLELSKNSEISTKLNILKSDNYTIGLKAMTCETCSFLNLGIEPTKSNDAISGNLQTGNYSLRSNETALSWVYSNNTFNLTKGTYDVKIYSDSISDLDIIAIYPVKNNSSINTVDGDLQNQDTRDAFAPAGTHLPPARISEYEKINPTKYSLKISNATRPYVISFAESYDPLWQAYIDTRTTDNANGNENGYKTNSIPLYGLTNGFYINKSGDYDLVLEYSPQVWFNQGLVISMVSLVSMAIIFLLTKGSRKKLLSFTKSPFRKNRNSI